METQASDHPFQNIPRKKLEDAIAYLNENFSNNGLLTTSGAHLVDAFHRYWISNIPVDYWYRDMFNFEGDKSLLKRYAEITRDIPKSFRDGVRVCFAGAHGVGKQLDLETELPTPNGFIKLLNLKEGDQLFDENGNICNVIKLHPINISPESYRISFDDGTTINACADHLWLTYTLKDRRSFDLEKLVNKRRDRRRALGLKHKRWLETDRDRVLKPTIKSTKEIFHTLRANGKQEVANHSIICTQPLNYDKKDLPIDPYVLGCWLGDGTTTDGSIECADKEILDNIVSAGYNIYLSKSSVGTSKSSRYRIGDLVNQPKGHPIGQLKLQLKTINVLDNKHIPEIYLRSSFEQRLSLLQGLMDTDGCCLKTGLSEFCTVKENLAREVADLVCGLGIKTKIKKNKTTLNGKQCKNRYRITFTTKLPVFRLKRKLDRIRLEKLQESRTTHRFIIDVEPIDSVPMRCITVDSPSHLYLVTRSCIPTHNTMTCACILKRVVEHSQYEALYVNLTDVIRVLTGPNSDDKTNAHAKLLEVDFLVIDEVDQRFMGTENAADLFGRVLEPVMRTRIQNRMPLLFCTNSPRVEDSFTGSLKASIDSLMKVVQLHPVMSSKDFRATIGRNKK